MPNAKKLARRRATRQAPYRSLTDHKPRMIERRALQNLRWPTFTPVLLLAAAQQTREDNKRNGVGRPPMDKERRA